MNKFMVMLVSVVLAVGFFTSTSFADNGREGVRYGQTRSFDTPGRPHFSYHHQMMAPPSIYRPYVYQIPPYYTYRPYSYTYRPYDYSPYVYRPSFAPSYQVRPYTYVQPYVYRPSYAPTWNTRSFRHGW